MEQKKTAGRPRKLHLVTLDECIAKIRDHYQGKLSIAKQTLYNKINTGVLKRYGPRHAAMLDWNEVEEKLCS